MEFRKLSFDFPRKQGDGPQVSTAQVRFPRAVERVAAGIIGYSAIYDGREDHHLGRLEMRLSAAVNPSDTQEVLVTGTFGLRDWSNTWDDPYRGNIQYVLLADLVPVTNPPPGGSRGDLVITGQEITQAIQHFRSAQHLDSINVSPDNSIRLVAAKPTGVRVYADYDRSSGLPVITSLSGELSVQSSGGSMTLAPVAPITPRRDSSTERRLANHTLNFIIPEALCMGDVTLRAKVFDAANPMAFSETVERTISFLNAPPINVFAVGINYTGPDVVAGTPANTLTAPPMSAFTNIFQFTELIYPIPSVALTGYMTIDYDEEIKSDISKGCDKFGDLRNRIKDLRGDSTDIYYGLLNSGVDTGSVGGCGGSGNAGVGIVGAQGTVAHELGHVLGRKHAPCDNVTRCARPLNTDDDYPNYAGYDSDSIGEFGFDTRNGNILDPSMAHDFMGYSGSAWISPYSYKALLSRVPGGVDGGSGFASSTMSLTTAPVSSRRVPQGDWIPMKAQHLFLSLTIDKERQVNMREAFHFPAWPQATDPAKTPFVVEVLDREGRVLISECLYEKGGGCGCGCGEWPKQIDQGIPYNPEGRKLVIRDCERVIFEKDIPDPPKVAVRCTNADDEKAPTFDFEWSGEEYAPLWYLLQWRDSRGTWRGAAPRTQDNRLSVPRALFKRQRELVVRLLATSGIATGVAEWTGQVKYPRPSSPDDRGVTVLLPGVSSTGVTVVPAVVRVSVLDRFGASVTNPEVHWYGSRGGEIGHGRTLDLRVLPVGQSAVRAVVLDSGQESGAAGWLVERTPAGEFRVIRGTVQDPDPCYKAPKGENKKGKEEQRDAS